jgi:4-hydroxy-tetrahydrodipicolinate synthase
MPILNFEGVFPILATPFHDDENLDLESFDRLVRFIGGLGVDGITILGVLGEANRLLDSERETLIRTAVTAAGKMPVIVGASHSGTRAALELAQMAQELGAQAVMVTPHAEAVPNDERIVEYYKTIAGGVKIPIVLQDHPASTQVHMTASLLLRLVRDVPQVASIKEEAVPPHRKSAQLTSGMKERKVPVLTGLGALYGLFDLEAGSSGFNTGFAFRKRSRPWSNAPALRTGKSSRNLHALPAADRVRTATGCSRAQGNPAAARRHRFRRGASSRRFAATGHLRSIAQTAG